jgi:hypothetical protein
MTATHNTNSTVSCAPVLYLALDLGASTWNLAFSVGLGQKPVSNGPGGHNFFGQVGTRPKCLCFGEVVPAQGGNGFFARIGLTTG